MMEDDIREASDMGFEDAREGFPSRVNEFPVQFRKYYRKAYNLIVEMRENEHKLLPSESTDHESAC